MPEEMLRLVCGCGAKLRVPPDAELSRRRCPRCQAALADARRVGVEPREALGAIGGFRLLRKIGSGGMATVYQARREGVDGYCAIKILHDSIAEEEEQLHRFRREALIAMRVRHPHIVAVHGVDQEGDRHYIAMELVDGVSLERAVAERGPLPWREALRYVRQVATALAECNRHLIVHRDIKPENILVDRSGAAKLTDFGFAKLLDGASDELTEKMALTVSGTQLGTPVFMPPEQIDDAMRATPSADVYALAATVFDVVAGRPPFDGKGAIEVMEKVIRERPPRLRTYVADAPRALDELVDWCMEKDPALRPQDPETLLRLLDRVEAAPEDDAAIRRERRRMRPLPWLLIGLVAAIVVLVVALVVVLSM